MQCNRHTSLSCQRVCSSLEATQSQPVLVLTLVQTQRLVDMVCKYAIIKNVRIKCNRKNRCEMGLGHIHAGSYCRKYRYYGTVTTGGPTLVSATAQNIASHLTSKGSCATSAAPATSK